MLLTRTAFLDTPLGNLLFKNDRFGLAKHGTRLIQDLLFAIAAFSVASKAAVQQSSFGDARTNDASTSPDTDETIEQAAQEYRKKTREELIPLLTPYFKDIAVDTPAHYHDISDEARSKLGRYYAILALYFVPAFGDAVVQLTQGDATRNDLRTFLDKKFKAYLRVHFALQPNNPEQTVNIISQSLWRNTLLRPTCTTPIPSAPRPSHPKAKTRKRKTTSKPRPKQTSSLPRDASS